MHRKAVVIFSAWPEALRANRRNSVPCADCNASGATHHAPDQAAFWACPLKQPTLASPLTCLRFYPPSLFQATGLYRFYLPLIADFWSRILVRRQSHPPRENQRICRPELRVAHKLRYTPATNGRQLCPPRQVPLCHAATACEVAADLAASVS